MLVNGFPSDMESEMESTLSRFVDGTKLSAGGTGSIHRNLDRCEK